MTDDVRKLLGGYATGTLSQEEKQLLYDAALHDDDLFAALADEHALKELLEDSTVRAQILRATEEPKFTFTGALQEWFERPKAKALAATGMVLLAIIGFNTFWQPVAEKPEQVAVVRERPPAAVEPTTPKPQPKAAPRLARKAQKPTPEADQASQSPAAPPPAGGVVGGIAGGAPAVSSLRYAGEAATAKAVAQFRYELLKRGPDGAFSAVPSDTAFIDGDVIRVRVTALQDGAVALSGAGQPTISEMVTAGQSVTLPSTGGIRVASGTQGLVLTFSGAGGTGSVEIPVRHRAP
jgi:hypothetical protein